jgi:hypothetical protein
MKMEKRFSTVRNFGDWLKLVDWYCSKLCGLGIEDLPDLISMRDLYDQGVSPKTAARMAYKAAREDVGM